MNSFIRLLSEEPQDVPMSCCSIILLILAAPFVLVIVMIQLIGYLIGFITSLANTFLGKVVVCFASKWVAVPLHIGSVTIRLKPYWNEIVIDDVVMDNPTGSKEPVFLKAKRLSLRFNLASLLGDVTFVV